jgi:hypothetical protein
MAAALGFAACAATPAHPVAMTQEGDDQLSCPQIDYELHANAQAAEEQLRKDRSTERANTAKVISTAVPFVGLVTGASIDLSNVEQIKARALLDRNERLTYLARTKGCTSQ